MADTMTRSDWMAREAQARDAANRWSEVARQHEQEAQRNRWSPSVMTAMTARNNEARCRSAMNWARQMMAEA